MIEPLHQNTKIEVSAELGRYFRYMSQFVDFTEEDAGAIRETKSVIEKHLPEVIDKFYAHLMRYPPTRKFFLKADGSVDQEYLELRMRHQANFWLRTADANFDDEYASYLDYVGRAHTSRGADPRIYIAERYVIGQVGFVSHAITEALSKELRGVNEDLEVRGIEAWNKLMMIVLEMLARAYDHEREVETFDALVQVEEAAINNLATRAYEKEHNRDAVIQRKKVRVARVEDVPVGERKLLQVEGLAIGLFHLDSGWSALRNSCLHRGGPVCTGTLEERVLTCPWHGFQYDVTTGELLVDPSARLDSYPVVIENEEVYLELPEVGEAPAAPAVKPPAQAADSGLKENEFRVSATVAGTIKQVKLDDKAVAVYNVGGTYFATSDYCTHRNNSLSKGNLAGNVVTCFFHGSQFDVRTGQVVKGPAERPLETYRVVIDGDIGRVEKT